MKTHLDVRTKDQAPLALVLCGTKANNVWASLDLSEVDCKRCKHYMVGPTSTFDAQVKFLNEQLEEAALRNEIVSPNEFKAIDKNHCQNCGEFVRVQIFKGSGYCSDDCRKKLEEPA